MKKQLIFVTPINRISKFTKLFFARKTQKIISNLLIAILLLAAVSCKEKPKEPQVNSPMPGMASPQMPAAVPQGADPHSGMKAQAMPADFAHKGKVVTTMDAAGYTYIEAEENGQKLWLAVLQTKVKVGDVIEFPDSPPMINFRSKTLNRTFDKIIFASALRVNGK